MEVLTAPAAQQLVGGLRLPKAVAGNAALELCNTVAGWGDDEPRDYLATYPHLVALVRSLGLVSAASRRELLALGEADPAAADLALRETRRFRADLYAVLTGDPAAPLPRLNRVLRRTAADRRIASVGTSGPRWDFGDQGLRRPLTVLAWEAHRLLDGQSGVAPAGVRRCPGDGCGWLFADPRGQRRWCVMSLCGNRAKARRHAARNR